MKKIAFFDLSAKMEGALSIYIVEQRRDGYTLRDTIETSAEDAASPEIANIAGRLKGIGESTLSLPLNRLNFRIIELPFSDTEKIREVLPFELKGIILDSPDNYIFDCHILGKVDDRYRLLAVYIKKDTLKQILHRLGAFGADPGVVTSIDTASIVRSSVAPGEIASMLLNPEPDLSKDRVALAAQEIKTPTINLRRGEFSCKADTEKTKKSLRVTALLAALLIVVFLANISLNIVSAKNEISTLREGIRETYLSLFPDELAVSELHQLKAHLKSLKEEERYYIGISPLSLLQDLSRLDMPGAKFTEITVDREQVVLGGEAPSLSDVQEVKGRLRGSFAEVHIADAKPHSEGKTLFTIVAEVRE